MKFGLLYELQLPRPWTEESEHRLVQDALAEVEVADRLGFDHVWANEHHFLEEYSHNSAPEVFLAAAAGRTRRIRIGHAVVLAPPNYNPPARVAERIAMLDLVSSGRAEWGTGSSASRAELEGFNIDPALKKEMWAEATEQSANMMAMTPYPGFQGRFFSMPARNVIPKPLQKPHPPLWLACSNRETIHVAARNGVGALAFAFVDPADAAKWAGEYYEIIKSEACVPIGHSVNANIAMATGFSVHHDEAEAKRRGSEGFQFFGFALGHHYVYGEHTPGVTNVWERFERGRDSLPPAVGNGIGTPAQLIERFRQYQAAGVDQVIFVQQAGRNTHDDIIASLELFAAEVMPVMKADAAAREARKAAELAPYIEAALARKRRMAPLERAAIPPIAAYGRSVVAGDATPASISARRGGGINIPTEDPSERRPRAGTGDD